MIIRDGKNVILSAAKPENVIVAELKNTAACKNYSNCISGTFQHNNAANAILISNGRVISNTSAHGWLGFPDSVIMCLTDGTIAIDRLVSIPEEKLAQVKWAISGMGLLDNYNPSLEGYSRIVKGNKIYDYSDVLRRTCHTALGVKDGEVYGFYLNNMTAAEVNDYLKEQGMQSGIMLDGGHVAAINCDEYSANASQKQHNIVQFVFPAEETERKTDEHDVKMYSLAREGNKAVSANFKVREYKCKDGSDAIAIHPELADLLQKIRTHFGRPVIINSAFRTHEHNKKVGGEADSQHLYGRAADIVVTGVSPKKVAGFAETQLKDRGGIGIYSDFLHVDVRNKKARWNG